MSKHQCAAAESKAFDGIPTISVLLVQNQWCGLFSLMVGTVSLCPYTVHTGKRFVPYWYKVCTIGTSGKECNSLWQGHFPYLLACWSPVA